MADYDGGRVFVSVVPSFRNFQRLIGAEAAKAGREAGRDYQREFEKSSSNIQVPAPPKKDAGRAGGEAGGAYADEFQRRVQRAFRALPEAKLTADSTDADRKLASLRRDLGALGDQRVGVDVDARAANAEIDRIDQELRRLERRNPNVQVRADTGQAIMELAAINAYASRLDGRNLEMKVDFDAGLASAQISTFLGRMILLTATAAALAPAIVPAAAAASVAIAGIGTAALGALGGVTALVTGLLGIGDAVGAMADVQKNAAFDAEAAGQRAAAAAYAVEGAQRSLANAERGLANARANAASAAEAAARRVARAQEGVARAQEDAAEAVENAQRRMADAQRNLGRAQESAARAAEDAARRVVDAREAVADAEEDAARRIEDAARRVADAREAVIDAEESATRRVADALRRQADAERSLERAQRTVVDAQRALTRAREDARERLEDYANEVRAAALAEEDAELALERAQMAMEDARRQRQRAVQEAEREARNARDRLREMIAEGVASYEDVQRAIGAVEAAEAHAASERERALSADDLASREAELNFRQAQLRLDEARERNIETQEEAREAQQAGVDGAEAVLNAERRLADARESEVDAARRLREAEEAVTEARVDGAERVEDAQQRLTDALVSQQRAQEDAVERIADAQQRLTDALRDQQQQQEDSAARIADAQRALTDAQAGVAEAQEDGARRVADAQRGVTDAIRAQEEQQRTSAAAIVGAVASVEGAQAALAQAMASTADQGSTSMRKLQQAMDDLSPAGRAFASFLFGLKPYWDELRRTAQEGLLPGLQRGIEALIPLFPTINDLMGKFATVMGTIFERMGEDLAGPRWAPFWEFMAAEGPGILLRLAEAFGNLAVFFADLMIAFAPFTEMFIEGFLNLTETLANWAASLDENAGFQRLLGYITEAGPQFMDFFGSLLEAIVALIESMAPFGPVVLDILTAFFDLISSLPPAVISAFVLGLIGLVFAFSALAPLLGFIGTVATGLAAGLGLVAAVVGALGGPLVVIVGAIVLFAAALVAAYMHSETFRDIVNRVFRAVGDVISVVWQTMVRPALEAFWGFLKNVLWPAIQYLWHAVVRPLFKSIGDAIRFAWERVIQPALAALTNFVQRVLGPAIMWLWRNVIEPAWNGIKTAIKIAWGIIEIALKAFVYFLRDVLGPRIQWFKDRVIDPVWSGIQRAIEAAWRAIKPILQALGDFIRDRVAPAFERGVEAIGKAWEGIKALAAKPINFVIETVYMKGIRPVFNRIADVVDADHLPVVRPIRYAVGGVLPGYTPGRDVHTFYSPTAGTLQLSGGEGIARPEIVRAVGAERWNAANAAARQGNARQAVRYLGGYADGGILSFADGGIFGRIGDLAAMAREGVQSALSSIGRFVLGGLKKAAETALRPVLRQMDRLPGGSLTGMLRGLVRKSIEGILDFAGKEDAVGVLQGTPFGRFASGWPPPQRGLLSSNTRAAVNYVMAQFGVRNIGTLGARSNRSDHPYGKALDAMIRNWDDPEGIRKGNQIANFFVANPRAFGTKYVIWRDRINSGGGWRPYIHPSGNTTNPTLRHMDHVHVSLFDDGGWLQPGLSMIANATGRPERVLSPSQESAIDAALRTRGVGGDGAIYATFVDRDNVLLGTMEGVVDSSLGGMGRRLNMRAKAGGY